MSTHTVINQPPPLIHNTFTDDAAKAAVWPRLVAAWPAYDDYVESSGRNIRVFHLVPVEG